MNSLPLVVVVCHCCGCSHLEHSHSLKYINKHTYSHITSKTSAHSRSNCPEAASGGGGGGSGYGGGGGSGYQKSGGGGGRGSVTFIYIHQIFPRSYHIYPPNPSISLYFLTSLNIGGGGGGGGGSGG